MPSNNTGGFALQTEQDCTKEACTVLSINLKTIYDVEAIFSTKISMIIQFLFYFVYLCLL